jgi:hypothetical protein
VSGHRIPPTLEEYLKDRINGNPRPQTLDLLKGNIRREIQNIPQETFLKLMENLVTQAVIGQRGAYNLHRTYVV